MWSAEESSRLIGSEESIDNLQLDLQIVIEAVAVSEHLTIKTEPKDPFVQFLER
jgi:hypothetical protein